MKPRVMIVDDEPDIREIVRLALGRLAGWDVVVPETIDEAVELAVSEPLDAILLDLMMPGRDGVEVAFLLGANPASASIPLVLLTARAVTPADLRGAPITAVLSKPFDPLTLAADVQTALNWTE